MTVPRGLAWILTFSSEEGVDQYCAQAMAQLQRDKSSRQAKNVLLAMAAAFPTAQKACIWLHTPNSSLQKHTPRREINHKDYDAVQRALAKDFPQ